MNKVESSSSAPLINSILKMINGESYLEIGVAKGTTINEVVATSRVGVDPFPLDEAKQDGKIIHSVTSDDFFSELSNDVTYDFVFIDGLHTFEQTARDFVSSLRHSTASTVWLIDDVVPDSWAAAQVSIRKYRQQKIREIIRNRKFVTTGWQGDVYRLVWNVSKLPEVFEYRTVIGQGRKAQTLVWFANGEINSGDLVYLAGRLQDTSNLPEHSTMSWRNVPASLKPNGQPIHISDLPSWYVPIDERQILELLQTRFDLDGNSSESY